MSVEITDLLSVKLPDGTWLQVGGDEASIRAVAALLGELPAETRGTGWLGKVDGDMRVVNSAGEVVRTVPGVECPVMPTFRPEGE